MDEQHFGSKKGRMENIGSGSQQHFDPTYWNGTTELYNTPDQGD